MATNNDLMNTQTGGEGETVQIQTQEQITPEQFDVNIKAQDTPIDSEQQNIPIEPPVQPPVQREITEQEVVGASPSEFVEAQETFTEEPPSLPESEQTIAPSVIVDEDPDFYPYIPEETVEEESPFYPFETESETLKKSFENTKEQINQDLTNTGLKPVIDIYKENEEQGNGIFGKIKKIFKKDEDKKDKVTYEGTTFDVESGDEVDVNELSDLGYDVNALSQKTTIDPSKRLDEQEIKEEEDLTDIIDKESIIGKTNELLAKEQEIRNRIKTSQGESLKSLRSELKSVKKTLNELKKSGDYKEEKDIYKEKALAKGALDPYYYNPKTPSISGVEKEEKRTWDNFVVKNPLSKDISNSIFSNRVGKEMNEEEANLILRRLFVHPSRKAYFGDASKAAKMAIYGLDDDGKKIHKALTYEEVLNIDRTFRTIANWAQSNNGVSNEGKYKGRFKAGLFPTYGFLPETTVEVFDKNGNLRKVTLFSGIYENSSQNELVKNGYGVSETLEEGKAFDIPSTRRAYYVPNSMIKSWEKTLGSKGFKAETFKQQQRLARLKDANGQPYLQSDKGMFGAGVTGFMDKETYDAQKRLEADVKIERDKSNKKGFVKGEVKVTEESRFGEGKMTDFNPIEEWRTKNVKPDFSYGKFKMKDIPLELMRNTSDAIAWAKSNLPGAKEMEFTNPNIFEQDQDNFKKYIDGLGFKGISVKPLGTWYVGDLDYVRLDGKGKSLIIDLNEGSDDLNAQQLKRLTDWIKVSQDDPQSDFIKDFTSVFDKDYAIPKLVAEKTALGEKFTVSFQTQAGKEITITNKNGQLDAQEYFNELEFQQAYYTEIKSGIEENTKTYSKEVQPFIDKFKNIQEQSDKSILELEKQISDLEYKHNRNEIEDKDFASQFEALQNKVLAVNENLINGYKELQSSLGNNKPLLDQINKDNEELQTANSKLNIISDETDELAGMEMARIMADNTGPRTVVGNITAAVSSGFMKPFIATVSAASDLLIQAGLYPKGMTKDEAIKQNNEWKTEFLYGELTDAMEKSFGTYMSPGYQERLSMPGEAIYGAIESIGTQSNPLVALLSKTPLAPVASMMGYASQSYTEIEEYILKSPDLKNIPEYQKKLIAIPYAMVMAAIDKYAYGKIAAGKSSITQRLMVGIVNKALEKLPKNATLETIEAVIKGDVKSNIGKFILALNRAGITEFETEGIQAATLDVGFKELWDNVLNKDAFNTGDVFGDYVETIIKSAASGYIGGAALGGAGRTVEFLGTGNINMINPEDYNFFKVVADDPQLKELYASKVANRFGRGEIDKVQAEKMMLDFENLVALDKKVLDDITGEDRLEMVKLMIEKQKIQERIKELDESQRKLPNYKLESVNKKIEEIVARTEERINKQQEYDKENEQRISSEIGEGQESIETQPITETSQEEVSPSGMVQEEQTEVTPTEEITTEETITPTGEVTTETEITPTEEVVKPETVTETTVTNEFDELAEINKMTSPTKKNKAMKAFNEKYGEKAARISEIDSKFTSIVSKLESKELIKKKC